MQITSNQCVLNKARDLFFRWYVQMAHWCEMFTLQYTKWRMWKSVVTFELAPLGTGICLYCLPLSNFTTERYIFNGKTSKLDFDWLNSTIFTSYLIQIISFSSSFINAITGLQFSGFAVNSIEIDEHIYYA